ncbi:DNA-processing protein DprA [Actinotignum sanguinis]|uniref:DNA-processing protein DprA n=2 Tax=Actinomycetaceae TaxID=2049 RepID=A0ABZ0RCY0_9ACTO|nr:DNA-processing protein DprA [Actinotignum sanguinis]WPJ89374.1 DNA-processing protein DprA [Schaalia turicensis]MDE1552376.1 DNA-processing protein DprA [Actinotignum sanguinis]MDE1566006.1 DNA-processing protein DprA [Actinotignum sanguinis]MDE1577233.1 DNA-processing protein DprA [Actinotignum sanguinis]MDE1641882.1 DNA-processing protein DprA [Actinotignum sanguinis]
MEASLPGNTGPGATAVGYTGVEEAAAMAWTRLAEGEDYHAVALTEHLGYVGALSWLEEIRAGAPVPEPLRTAATRWNARYDADAFARDRELLNRGYGFTYPGSPTWPQSLTQLGEQRPLGLWWKGNIEALERPALAMVGSRASTDYGEKIATDFSYELTERGALIVSGGAIGIDAAAHRGAVLANAPTAVVFASGINRPYPKAHQELFARILDAGGLALSETAPGNAPHRHRFLARNRIIAGLSRAVVVIEAPYRSGAINTAGHAHTYGIPVGAVPGSIYAMCSTGCHRLLREGAVCITGVEDIVDMLGFSAGQQLLRADRARVAGERSTAPNGDGAASRTVAHALTGGVQLGFGLAITDPLAGDPRAVRVRDALPARNYQPLDKIAQTAGMGFAEVMAALGKLEVAGIAESRGGKWRLTPQAREASRQRAT